MAMEEQDLGIGEVARRTGLSVHALRYYEREGLMLSPRVARGSGGRRLYSTRELKWLGLCTKLRRAQMPLAQIRRYAELVREGSGNEGQRLDLLRKQQRNIEAQLDQLNECLKIITRKVGVYERALANGDAEPFYTAAS